MSEMIKIAQDRYNYLLFREAQLDAMEAMGVDNWEGYEEVDWPDDDEFFKDNA